MEKIYTSAAKIVFILMAVGVNIALFTGYITSEQYIPLAAMAFTFYFANKGSSNDEYLGK